jgi:hypothetical protein
VDQFTGEAPTLPLSTLAMGFTSATVTLSPLTSVLLAAYTEARGNVNQRKATAETALRQVRFCRDRFSLPAT